MPVIDRYSAPVMCSAITVPRGYHSAAVAFIPYRRVTHVSVRATGERGLALIRNMSCGMHTLLGQPCVPQSPQKHVYSEHFLVCTNTKQRRQDSDDVVGSPRKVHCHRHANNLHK